MADHTKTVGRFEAEITQGGGYEEPEFAIKIIPESTMSRHTRLNREDVHDLRHILDWAERIIGND